MTWIDEARKTIREVQDAHRHTVVTAEIILAAIDRAYPFGQRENHPYKAWLKARGEWMALNMPTKSRNAMSPMERAKARGRAQ